MNDQRRLFFGLVDLLAVCPDPYPVAYELLRETLVDIEALHRELGAFADDLVTVARAKRIQIPEDHIKEIRLDLARMAQEPRRAGVLFRHETRERCGRAAIPLLASAIISAQNWVEFANEWLESIDRLRIQVDAIVGRLSGSCRADRQDSRPCSRVT